MSYIEQFFDQERIDEINRKESFEEGYKKGYEKACKDTALKAYKICLEYGLSKERSLKIAGLNPEDI